MTDPLKKYEEELKLGSFPDLPERQAPFLSQAVNAKVRENAIQPFEGKVPLFEKPQASEPTRGIASTDAANGDAVYFGTLSDLYYWAATATGGAENRTATTIGSASATAYSGKVNTDTSGRATLWSMESWGSFMVASNGVDPVQWDTGSGFKELLTTATQSLPFSKADIIVSRDPFMLAIDGRVLRWCDRDNIQDWLATSLANFAGERTIRDVDGDFVAGLKYQGEVALFSRTAMHFVSFIGAPRVFASQKLRHGIGCLGKAAVAELDGWLYGMGPAGIWRANLQGYDYIDADSVHDTVYDDINLEQAAKCVVCPNHVQKTVSFHYPSTESLDNDKSVVYNTQRPSWTQGSVNVSACDREGALSYLVVGNKVGDILVDGAVGSLAQESGVGELGNTATASLVFGFGELGFGELGFGGKSSFNG